MKILSKIKKAKEKILSLSAKNINKEKVRILDLPIFSISTYSALIYAFFSLLVFSLGAGSLIILAINTVMLSLIGLSYSKYHKEGKKIRENVKRNDFNVIMEYIDFQTLKTEKVDYSVEKNNEFINVLNSLKNTDMNKKEMEEVYSLIMKDQTMRKQEVSAVLNDANLITIQRKYGISSALYAYAFLLKLEEYVYMNSGVDDINAYSGSPLLSKKEEYEHDYILSLKQDIISLNKSEEIDYRDYMTSKEHVMKKEYA